MTRLWLLFATLAFSCLFLFYRPEGNFTFPLSEINAPLDTAAYFIYEHIAVIIFAWIIYDLSPDRKYLYLWFLLLCVFDMVLFLLYYKSPILLGIPWNAMKCGLFGIPLIYETWKQYSRR